MLTRLGPRGYRVTAVSAFELALGSAHRANPAPVLALLAAPTLVLTPRGGLRGGEALASLRRDGRQIDVRDALQAGVCLDAGLPLAHHLEGVPGLEVVAPDRWP